MRKKILLYMETDTDFDDKFIKDDIEQELNCASCFYENIVVKVFDIEEESE